MSNLFGQPSNADRGRSRLSVLAIAYARFFLSDVLEVEESNMTQTTLQGCNLGSYGKLKPDATNFQTPVMDLSPIFGTSNDRNNKLKDIVFRLNFVSGQKDSFGLDYSMVSRGTSKVYLSGSPYSNVDHFSNYIHSRFIFLHTKFFELLYANGNSETSKLTLFESARVFVVMIAETIARDLANQLGTLPVPLDFSKGIPKEFLLMTFADRFPKDLPHYGDTTRLDNFNHSSPICAIPSVGYESTTYNITLIDTAHEDVDNLAWVGYSAMYTRARNGGFLSNSSRCLSNGVGILASAPHDPIAAVIQRGRDYTFPTCEEYRSRMGLPSVSFFSFGNGAFADLFAAQYGGNFSKVELAVCMLLDADLRDRMMGSLIQGVLALQNSLHLCPSNGISNFADTPVAELPQYNRVTNVPDSSSTLGIIAAALCRNSPKIDMRGLTMVDQLSFGGTDLVVINLAAPLTTDPSGVDHFIACTTGNPFLAANAEYAPDRLLLKEGSTALCDWALRDPGNSSFLLGNAPRCYSHYPPTTAPVVYTRRCFCYARDGCHDHGVVTPGSSDTQCTCDAGFIHTTLTTGRSSNAFCERSSYPQAVHLMSQFGSNTQSPQSTRCSSVYSDNLPSALPQADHTNFFVPYCSVSTCTNQEGHTLSGACNDPTNADLGRVGSALGRVVSANYPNGISFSSNGTDWKAALQSRFVASATALPQNALFRGMGKLLIDDVFRSSAAELLNEKGYRSATDASNPAQFKNLVSGWIDESQIFPEASTVAPYNGTSEFGPTPGTLSAFPYTITDESEKLMRSLFFRRYNQIFSRLNDVAPCKITTRCNVPKLARCVKEIAILEFRAVAREFLEEAKSLFPTLSTFKKFPQDPSFVTPVEIAGAQIFDLHLKQSGGDVCSSTTLLASGNPLACFNSLYNLPLRAQTDISSLSSATVNEIGDLVKSLGLGSVNAYLAKLGAPLKAHPLSDHLLLDLHDSPAAEYAINFGILETILDQDSRSNMANVTCREFFPYNDPQGGASWNIALGEFLPSAANRTLCSLISLMRSFSTNPVYNFGFTASNLKPNMFRTGAGTGSC